MRANTASVADLVGALDDVEPLLSRPRRSALAHLRARLSANQFRVLVVGEAKRGKSTLANALIGREVLPAGVLPVTAVVTTLVGGSPEAVTVRFDDGHHEQHGVELLAEFVTESANPHNEKKVAAVTVTLDVQILRDGLQLVDTPGTGSVFEHNTRTAKEGLDDVDAAIFVFTADPPISAAEARLLTAVHDRAQFLLVVLNKIDYLAPDDVRRVHDFTAHHVADLVDAPVEVFDCSASRAIAARLNGDAEGVTASGICAVENAFTERVSELRDQALPASIGAHAARLVSAELDEALLRLRIVRARTADDQRRVREFRDGLDVVMARQDELHVLVRTRRRLLSDQLTEAAARFRTRLLKEVAANLGEFLDDERRAATGPRQLEREGHLRAAGLIRAAVEAWRHEQDAALAVQFGKVAETIASDVNRAIERVRHAGRSLLDVDLRLDYEPPRVPESTRFHFDFSEEAGPTELLAGMLRRCLPGKMGRRRAIRWLDSDVRGLVDRHTGRARADLDDRLGAACNELAQRSARGLTSLIDALGRVVDETCKTADDIDGAAESDRLDRAVDALRRVHHRLTPRRPTAVGSQPGRVS